MNTGKKEQPEGGSIDDLASLLAVIFSWLLLAPALLLIVVAAGGRFWNWPPFVQFVVILLIIACVLVFVLHRDNDRKTERILAALFVMPVTDGDVGSDTSSRRKPGDVIVEYFSSLGVVAIFLNLVSYSFSCYVFPLQAPLLALASLAIFLVFVIALLRFGAALRGTPNKVSVPIVAVSTLLTAFLFVFSVAGGSSTSCS